MGTNKQFFNTFADDFDSESFGGSSPYTWSNRLERTSMLEMENMMLEDELKIFY